MAGIVITVLLTILKIILILLLVILALVILVLVLPIRYETAACGDSRKGLPSLHAKVRVCALLKIVKVKACFHEGTLSWAVKIFGKAIMSGKQEILDLKKDAAEAETEPEKTGETPEAADGTSGESAAAEAPAADLPISPQEEQTSVTASPDAASGPDKEEVPAASAEETVREDIASAAPDQPSAKEMAKRRKKEEKERRKAEKEAAAGASQPGLSLGEKYDRLVEKIYKAVDKGHEISAMVRDPVNHRTVRRVKQAVFKILGHVLPRRCRVRLTFGTGDPAMTGQILGGIYAFYPWYADRGEFEINGDFEETLAYGKLYLEGRIHPAVPVFHAVFLLRDKNIRKLIFGRKKKKAA